MRRRGLCPWVPWARPVSFSYRATKIQSQRFSPNDLIQLWSLPKGPTISMVVGLFSPSYGLIMEAKQPYMSRENRLEPHLMQHLSLLISDFVLVTWAGAGSYISSERPSVGKGCQVSSSVKTLTQQGWESIRFAQPREESGWRHTHRWDCCSPPPSSSQLCLLSICANEIMWHERQK